MNDRYAVQLRERGLRLQTAVDAFDVARAQENVAGIPFTQRLWVCPNTFWADPDEAARLCAEEEKRQPAQGQLPNLSTDSGTLVRPKTPEEEEQEFREYQKRASEELTQKILSLAAAERAVQKLREGRS